MNILKLTQLIIESLGLSGRALERGIRRSEVRLPMRTHNFSMSLASDKN